MAMRPRRVRVELSARRGWMIDLPEEREPVVCETLQDAQRMAHIFAVLSRPCELVVHNAYHHVLYWELLSGDDHAAMERRPSGSERLDPGDVGADRDETSGSSDAW